ncbi:dTDP-4-dehydrorhamnose reductase [Pelosinus sp. UFO1]|uniref:dTDP-4-dehydrorhamnose reductase n=1 Tax=Pelosinus sp. UFO1 TaxID=484770 RepID=UPI000A785F47|nr:dTDP-4-dehydrorhamnose reductase [Pelosinus sp. UFO1]
MMKILIVGANGQLGRECKRQFQEKYELFLYDSDSLNITNIDAVSCAIAKVKPDVVINAAAYTNVEKAEEDIDNAFKVNATGAENLALICKKYDSKFIHISTDYVFDGTKDRPYEEFDTHNPLSVYGRSKSCGEKLIEQVGGKYFILRTSWLYGDGNNFVRTMLRLSKEKSEIAVVGDQYGTPTYTKDLCSVIEKLMYTEFYGIYHASNEGSCSWCEFAKEIMRVASRKTTIKSLTTAEYPVKAKRPMYSVMENRLLKLRGINRMRPWQDALEDYLESSCE